MATNKFVASQGYRAQVQTVALTAYDVSTTYNISINSKTISTVGTGGTTATTAAALQVLLAASTYGEFTEVTWTVSSSTITATAVTAGTPFTFTKSVSGGTGTMGSIATSTSNQSPSDANDILNWSLGAVPISTDDLVFEGNAIDLKWNLDQLAAVTPNSVRMDPTYTGKIGLPAYNSGKSYNEYRPQYLQLAGATTTVSINSTAQRLKFDFGSTATAITVLATGPAGGDVSGLEACLIKGTSASNALEVYGGSSVGVAVLAGETANLTGGLVINGGGASVRLGSGVTLSGTITLVTGSLQTNAACTTLKQYGGTSNLMAGSITTVSLYGGTCYYQGSGTITTLNIYNGGVMDFTKDGSARTVTTTNLFNGARLVDSNATLSTSHNIVLACPISQLAGLDVGPAQTLQRTA